MSSTPRARDGRFDDSNRPLHRDQADPRFADRDGLDDRDRITDHRGTDRHAVLDRHSKVEAEKAEYGGVKVGSAFFGWLTAMGMAVLLTALLAAAGTALGLATGTDVGEAANDATTNPEGVGIAGIVGLGVILLVAYYCGGYVAGRMARFQGARQGIAVWVWALVIAALVALLGYLAGDKYNVLQQVNGFPRIPVDEGTLSTAGIITLVVALAASLIGAILGGLAGMRYHRKVDRAGFVD